ncbi:DUF1330 domain-containing protein [Hyphobacterium sp.]|uniref:DUF1330 domain-containing protein n=1 Tax=Hyphobacterium sp. TaxID=2004662 RepID=UPI003B52D9C1
MKNALEPTEAQISRFMEAGGSPVSMLNLLRFREKAAYPDGRDADLPGKDAYFRYAVPMTQLVLKAGGSLDFTGDMGPLLIGEIEDDWHMAAIMTYPSPRTLVEISLTPEFAEIAVHRKAGLEGQLLIPCRTSMP